MKCEQHGEYITRFYNLEKLRNAKESVIENVSRDRCEYCKEWIDD